MAGGAHSSPVLLRRFSLCALLSLLWSALARAQYDINTDIPANVPKNQFQSFISRPDIHVPKWDITVYDRGNISAGYWFVGIYEQVGADPPSPAWVSPQIYDNNGDLVWVAGNMFEGANTFDFRVIDYHGKKWMSVLVTYLESAFLLDEHYTIRKTIPLGKRGKVINMHDFNVIENGTRALALHRNITDPGQEQIDGLSGSSQGRCRAISQWFEERDITHDGWNTLFKWNSLDHIGLNESTMGDGRCRGVWDFLHANSIDKCPDGHYVLSGRHTNTIYKVDKDDGHIIWRLGGRLSSFKAKFKFSRQHHIRCRAQNSTHTTLTMLDNAKGQDSERPTHGNSRGITISLETTRQPMHASIVAQYDHPNGGYNVGRGSCEPLSNGNVWMGWSDRAMSSEHSPDGRMVMKAVMQPKWIRSYRSYKFDFVGLPTRRPDVVSDASPASHGHKGKNNKSVKTVTDVYVSWNGATEVAFWRVYAVHNKDDPGDSHLVATVPRTGFETHIALDGFASRVVLQALDTNGAELARGRSGVIITSSGNKVDEHDIVEDWYPETSADNEGTAEDSGHANTDNDKTTGTGKGQKIEAEDSTTETPAPTSSSFGNGEAIKFFAVGFGLSLITCFGIWVCARWVRQGSEVRYSAVADDEAGNSSLQLNEATSKGERVWDRDEAAHSAESQEKFAAFDGEDDEAHDDRNKQRDPDQNG